jgi:hypothetical protein
MALGVGLVAVLVATASDVARAGYSPDEEFTLFAVRGIHEHGLPLLPSGLLYDRGLAYSFAAWGAAATGLPALVAGRVVSLACSVLILALVFREGRRVSSSAVAAAAVLLVASSLPFWVSATTARFYAPFLLCYLVALALVGRPDLSARGGCALALAAVGARWTHELAFTLVAVPVVAGACAQAADRRWQFARRTAWMLGGLVVGQLLLFAVHALAPASNGDVMVRRFFLWQVLNLFERPPFDLVETLPLAAAAGGATALALAIVRWRQDAAASLVLFVGGLSAASGQLGVGPFGALLLLPVVPQAWRRRLVGTSLAVLAGGCIFWMVALVAAGLDPGEAVARIGASGLAYPLDMLSSLVTESPVLMTVALAGLLARAAGRGGSWTPHERALHALWLGWVLWFGVIESGITVRYLLLPVTFMSLAIAVDLAALVRALPAARRPVALAACVVLAIAIATESWRGPQGRERRWAEERPTLDLSTVARDIQPDDLVASIDELACLMVGGRIDAWLVLDEFFRERFVVMREGQPTGTYTGAPAASSLAPLLERAQREHRRLIVVDILKDMPGFGPTDGLVPRQLAREDLRGEVVADGPGLRLVHIVPAQDGVVADLRPRLPPTVGTRALDSGDADH